MVTQATKRIATYERVSSEDQKERETIKSQTDLLVQHLSNDPDVVLVRRYADDGVSGTIPFADRPSGRRLLADAAQHRFDEVLVYRIDRLGRDDIDPLVVWKTLEALGITLRSVMEGISSPFMYAIYVAKAAEERRVFLDRTSLGMNRAAKEGRYTGGIVPLGYKVAGEKPNARLIPSDDPMWGDLSEADVVRRIYHLLAIEGWSCPKIAGEFNALGVPTAYQLDGRGVRGTKTQGKWRSGRIRNLVTNPLYRGEVHYGRRSTRPGGREVITGHVPRLVSDEVWYAAQETLARHRIMPKNGRHSYLLRGLIRCGLDGLHYCGTKSKNVWYRCNGQLVERGPVEGKCRGKSIKGDFVEPLVWSDVENFLRDPGDLVNELESEANEESGKAVAEAEYLTLSTALRDLGNQRDRVLDLHIRGHLTDPELDAHLSRVVGDRARIEQRLAEIQRQATAEPRIAPDLLPAVRQRLDEGLTEQEKQEVVRALVAQIVVNTDIDENDRTTASLVIDYRFPAVVSACTPTREGQNYTLARRVVRL